MELRGRWDPGPDGPRVPKRVGAVTRVLVDPDLAPNCFDRTLQDDAAALGRLDPAIVGTIEGLSFSRK
jgi:hypothetical protein